MKHLSSQDPIPAPDLIIQINKLPKLYDIHKLLLQKNIVDGYVYGIYDLQGRCVKYGQSECIDKPGKHADRIYRQILNAPVSYQNGKPQYRKNITDTDRGYDMVKYVKKFNEVYNTELEVADLTVSVWDMTPYYEPESFTSSSPMRRETLKVNKRNLVENHFIDKHNAEKGFCPPGNLKEQKFNLNFHTMFEVTI